MMHKIKVLNFSIPLKHFQVQGYLKKWCQSRCCATSDVLGHRLACVAWRFWLGESGRGQRNRETIWASRLGLSLTLALPAISWLRRSVVLSKKPLCYTGQAPASREHSLSNTRQDHQNHCKDTELTFCVLVKQQKIQASHQRNLDFFYEQYTGAPNDRMLQRTPEVSQMIFTVLEKPLWLIWSCSKNYLSVPMSWGTVVVTKVLGGFFVSSASVSYPYGSGRKFEDVKQPCFRQKIIRDVLSLYRNFQETFLNNNRNILVLKRAIAQLPKIVESYQKSSGYLRRMERLSRNFKLFPSFRNFQTIFAPSNSYCAEKSRRVPLCISPTLRSLLPNPPERQNRRQFFGSLFVCVLFD